MNSPEGLEEAAEKAGLEYAPIIAGEALDLSGQFYETDDVNWPSRCGFINGFRAGAEWKAKKIEVELEKEIKTWIPEHIIGGDEAPWKETKDVIIQWAEIVARYFFELGRKSF